MLGSFHARIGREGVYILENVPVETARKTRKGTVRERNPGYRLVAAMTPAVPMPKPIIPPKRPPLIVALVPTLVFEASCLNGSRLQSWSGIVLTCNAQPLLLS